MTEIKKSAKIYIAGHRGLVGSALWAHYTNLGFENLIGWRSTELDLRDRDQTISALADAKPDVVIMAAAKVGGIVANNTYPVEFLQDNIRIQANVFEAAHLADVGQLLFLGSSCIYPKFAQQPISEDSLLTGPLEPTNDAYAIAKIAGVLNIQAYRREYGRKWISGMPTNLYGERDNFDLQSSHVLPAMIRKFHDAKVGNAPDVTLWGTGSPLREFLHVADLARACHFLLENYDDGAPINIGWGQDVPIKELAQIVKETVGFSGNIVWDTTKPDGTPRKLLDTSKINNLGWEPNIELRDGIASTYQWYLQNL
ncbi:MAG: GDP-L-fucose synthase [Actinobacteria bacterium]|nr:GDP-L-fucose synthase [Actinomycetota bacterium]NBY15192.1 GDP-L-fucose synthase [Actinomycetota bacterium]